MYRITFFFLKNKHESSLILQQWLTDSVQIPQGGTNICSKPIIPRFSEVQRTLISVFERLTVAVLCTLEALDYRLATNIEVLCTF